MPTHDINFIDIIDELDRIQGLTNALHLLFTHCASESLAHRQRPNDDIIIVINEKLSEVKHSLKAYYDGQKDQEN